MKRLVRFIITALLLSVLISGTTAVGYATVYKKGDTDRDGEIMITDATIIQRLLIGMVQGTDGHIKRYGDIDGDGLSLFDITLIQRFLADINDNHHIGEIVSAEEPEPEIINGKTVVDGVTFTVSGIPDTVVINDPESVNKTLLHKTDQELAPEDVYIRINN